MTVTLQRRAAAHQPSLRQARLAGGVFFTIAGAATGIWTARMPTIELRLHLSHGQLSIALLALALGGLAGMGLTGRLVDRYSTRPVLTCAALALGPLLALPAHAPSLAVLVGVLLLFGFTHGTLNVSMNAYAVACETAYRRPIMTSFHAWFSIGGLIAAAAGATFSAADPTATRTFTIAGLATIALAAGALRSARQAPAPTGGARSSGVRSQPAPARHQVRTPRWRVAGLGAIAFCSLLCEGATADWSSVYVHDSLHSSLGTAAAAYAVFALVMTGGRLTGDRLVAALGPAAVVRGCAMLATVGFATGVLAGTPLTAIAGFGFLGAGLSCIVPQTYSTAGHLDAENTGTALSRVAALGYSGFVTGPVLIGALSARVGLAPAMLVLPVLTLFAAAAGGLVRAKRPKTA
jgi:MFS family permease